MLAGTWYLHTSVSAGFWLINGTVLGGGDVADAGVDVLVYVVVGKEKLVGFLHSRLELKPLFTIISIASRVGTEDLPACCATATLSGLGSPLTATTSSQLVRFLLLGRRMPRLLQRSGAFRSSLMTGSSCGQVMH